MKMIIMGCVLLSILAVSCALACETRDRTKFKVEEESAAVISGIPVLSLGSGIMIEVTGKASQKVNGQWEEMSYNNVGWYCPSAIEQEIPTTPEKSKKAIGDNYVAVSIEGRVMIDGKVYKDGIVAAHDPFSTLIDEIINEYFSGYLKNLLTELL